MSIKHLLALSLAPLIFSLTQTICAESDPIFVATDELGDCRLVGEYECKTIKHDAEKKCKKVHKKQARTFDADTIVMTETRTEEKTRPFYDGSKKRIKTTYISANHYQCRGATKAVAEQKNGSGKVPGTGKSDEARLRKLKNLYEQDLINEQEYKAQKQKILDSI